MKRTWTSPLASFSPPLSLTHFMYLSRAAPNLPMPSVPVSAVTGPTVISNFSLLGVGPGVGAPASGSVTSSGAGIVAAATVADVAGVGGGAPELAAGNALELGTGTAPARSACASASVMQRTISPLPLPMRPQGHAGSYG